MTRRKIEIKAIKDDRNRSVTFLKRKGGLFKKAHELSILCSVDVAVFVFGQNKKLYEYSSADMRDLIGRYQLHDGPNEHKGPGDFNGSNDDDEDDGDDAEAIFPTPPTYQRLGTSLHQTYYQTPSASPPISNSSFATHQHHPRHGYTPQPSVASRHVSRNDSRRMAPNMVSHGGPPGVPYMPTPPIYNPSHAQPGMVSHFGPQYYYPAHAPQQQPLPQSQPPPQAQASLDERYMFKPTFYGSQTSDSMPVVYRSEFSSLQQPHQPSLPIELKKEQPDRAHPPLLNTDTSITKKIPQRKSHSIFTPIEENKATLSWHLASFANDSTDKAMPSQAEASNTPGLNPVDTTSSAPASLPPQPSNYKKSDILSISSVPKQTFIPPPPPEDSKIASAISSTTRPQKPRLTVQIPDSGSNPSSIAGGSSISSRPADNTIQVLHHQKSIIGSPPSPSTSALISAGVVGPPDPLARPPPPSALPSQFLGTKGIPSPGSFYKDSDFPATGDNVLPSPLNFDTPIGDTGPTFLREDYHANAFISAAKGSSKRKRSETGDHALSEGSERPLQNKRILVTQPGELHLLQEDDAIPRKPHRPASVAAASSSASSASTSPALIAREVRPPAPLSVSLVDSSSNAAPGADRRHVAAQLAELLFDRPKTRQLYEAAAAKLDREDFFNKHDGLLKHYLLSLIRSANQEPASLPVWILRSKTQRGRVTELMWGKGTSNDQLVTKGQAPTNADEEISSDEEFDQAANCISLDADFFLKGQPFANFEIRLEYMVTTPADISDVLEHGDLDKLIVYLESHFKQASTGDYAWIEDLREIGYSLPEIAQLLYERKYDSPWIFFEPTTSPSEFAVDIDHHVSGCIHSLPQPPLTHSESLKSPASDSDNLIEVMQTLEAMCGLGGIIPYPRNRREWRGSVAFKQLNTVAELQYKPGIDITESIPSISEQLLNAIGRLQNLGFCCNSFTVLSIRQIESAREPVVHMASIDVSLPQRLDKGLRAISQLSPDSDRRKQLSVIQDTALIIIQAAVGGGNALNKLQEEKEEGVRYICALALQILTVGLLSYAQAHIGPLQPFFLDTPLRQISLLGTGAFSSTDRSLSSFSPCVTAHLVDLSCLGAMCRGPVLAFRACLEPSAKSTEDGARYDVRAKPEDILDTWGPGEIVFDSQHPDTPLTIRIGGGFISPPTENGTGKYHWDTVPRISKTSSPIDLKREILIGSIVTVNLSCKNNEKACWEASSGHFEELGTYRSYSEVTEHQFGLHLDQFILQTNKVWGKRRGRTVKARNLECPEDDMLITFLQFYWGVRVSFCTGVAQRVKLTQVIADLLPAFIKALTSRQARMWWADLEANHNIIARFHDSARQPLCDWLAGLPENINNFIMRLVRQILMTLEDTGLNPTGTEFVVAWPYDGIANRCFRIPLDEHNKWTVMLADSDDCATFAYATNTCLEAGEHRCRGPDPAWRDRISLLETAVLCPASKMPPALWSLTAEQTYFFHKLDNNLFWVKARVIPTGVKGANAAALVRLVSRQSIPLDVRQRLLFNEERKRQRRLREKDLASVPAKIVTVLASTSR